MPFKALNQSEAGPSSSANSEFPNNAFSGLSTDIVSATKALWEGQPQALNSATTQKVITAISEHITSLKEQITEAAGSGQNDLPSRKRVSEEAGLANGSQEKKPKLAEQASKKSSVSAEWRGATFDGVSFTVPQRKKFTLKVSPNPNEGVSVSVPGSETPEFGIPWSKVETVVCLPLPEKAQAQKSFVILPKGANGLQETSPSTYEPMVWTAPDTRVKGATENELTQAQAVSAALADVSTVLEPNPKDFTSEVPPVGGKKGDKAYHIKAFRGSKDGFLFLLPTGIIWAFKKPLIFISFSSVDSISYTSVLQRTFNLVISARASNDAEPVDYEFSMVDQVDFAGIDEYIKKNGLQDASLAEQRRAKLYNVNGRKGEANATDAAGPGELEKAEAEAEAAETSDEEDDENFDPGSDGESEGSGSSEDDEDGSAPAPRNLVHDELGSEAEDVEMSDEGEAEDQESE